MENENSCCFVVKIDEIREIPNADKIELAILKGWQSIVQKGTHKVGDLVVCLTTDAVLPQKFAEKQGIVNHLRKSRDPETPDEAPEYKLRVRTVKLRGVYSECILISFNSLGSSFNALEGQDLMEVLKIFKYEQPIKQVQLSSGRKIKYHQNPNFHVYYKFPNIKNVPDMFNSNDTVVITRKLHGTNARYGIVKKKKLSIWDKIKKFFTKDPWIDYEYVYGSHNVEKGSDSQGFYDTDVWKTVAEDNKIKEKLLKTVKLIFNNNLEELGSGFVIYGEIVGPGIQKGCDYGLTKHELYLFDIEINGEYLPDNEFLDFTLGELELEVVDYLYHGKWSKEIQEECSKPVLIPNSKMYHEGIVLKCSTGDRRKRAKIVNQEYLIQNEKLDGTDFH